MKLNIIYDVPKELYNCTVENVHDVLGGPTIIHLKGVKSEPLFLSALLHGNETTSFYVFQKILNEYKNKTIPRDIILFIGNTLGAKHGQRHLPDQPDYNRIWEEGTTPEHQVAADVLDYVKNLNLFANIDMHNNTGKNPYYACINTLKDHYIELASHFSKQIVYFTEPSQVQSMAFASLCPSVTLEAGLPGVREGIETVFNYVMKIMNLDCFEETFNSEEVQIYHTIGRIMVNKAAKVNCNDDLAGDDISLINDIDGYNFELIKKNTYLGQYRKLNFLYAINNSNEDITTDILNFDDGKVLVNRMFIPSMFTRDLYIMKEDCLGYIMERMTTLNC